MEVVVPGHTTPQQAVVPQVEFEREEGEHAVVQRRHPPGGVAGRAAWERR